MNKKINLSMVGFLYRKGNATIPSMSTKLGINSGWNGIFAKNTTTTRLLYSMHKMIKS